MRLLKKLAQKTKSVFRKMKSAFDKSGSYTGTPDEGNDQPEQDADDL